jgi:hypothetical protein
MEKGDGGDSESSITLRKVMMTKNVHCWKRSTISRQPKTIQIIKLGLRHQNHVSHMYTHTTTTELEQILLFELLENWLLYLNKLIGYKQCKECIRIKVDCHIQSDHLNK